MKRLAKWKWASVLALAGWAGSASAQAPPVIGPGCLPPPGCPAPVQPLLPTEPGKAPAVSPAPSTPEPSPSPAPATPTDTSGGFRGSGLTNYYQGSIAPAGSGASATSAAAATGMATQLSAVFPQIPAILPGLLTAANVESARPMDRVFFGYAYLDRFQVTGIPSISLPNPPTPVTAASTRRVPGFDLSRFDVGVEKTFLDCKASAYVRVPFLYATENVSGQAIDGLGDVSAGLKYVFWASADNSSLLTGGMTVSAPTARSTTVVNQAFILRDNNGNFRFLIPSSSVNPTFLQPWVAALFAGDRAFLQEYLGVIVPTDDRVSTFINNDVIVGFQVYRGEPGRLLSSITPTLDVQALLPINHVGSVAQAAPTNTTLSGALPPTVFPTSSNLNFSDQLFITGGLQFGLGDRAVLSTGVVTPVVGPRAFNYGVTFGLNLFY